MQGLKETLEREVSGGWWWGPMEETLDVADSLEELRDRCRPISTTPSPGRAAAPSVEDLDI
jgi:hypothetical protein